MPLQSINPSDGSLIREYPEATEAEVARVLAEAADAFESWRRTSFDERAAILRRTASLLRERRDALARLMALEMGKPVTQGRAETDKCAGVCDYYAEHAERLPRAGARPDRGAHQLRRLRAARRRCWRSCPGTSRCGRCSASRRRR